MPPNEISVNTTAVSDLQICTLLFILHVMKPSTTIMAQDLLLVELLVWGIVPQAPRVLLHSLLSIPWCISNDDVPMDLYHHVLLLH